MATLNLNQITERLNQEFSGEKRQLIFWYDATAEFQDEIDGLQLANAKIIKLTPNGFMLIKHRWFYIVSVLIPNSVRFLTDTVSFLRAKTVSTSLSHLGKNITTKF